MTELGPVGGTAGSECPDGPEAADPGLEQKGSNLEADKAAKAAGSFRRDRASGKRLSQPGTCTAER